MRLPIRACRQSWAFGSLANALPWAYAARIVPTIWGGHAITWQLRRPCPCACLMQSLLRLAHLCLVGRFRTTDSLPFLHQ
eukprot:COSAG01_NODE_42913_length_435_cov_0.818452_1_plen_79_part_01